MSGNRAEAQRWLGQGEREPSAARYTADGGFHAMACFQSQQAAEEFLKALPGGAPYEAFGADDSARGLAKDERIAALVRDRIAPPAPG